MSLVNFSFSVTWLVFGGLSLFFAFFWIMKTAPWQKIKSDSSAQNVFIGTTLLLGFIWSADVGTLFGIDFHLLMLATTVLMFGPQFAILSGIIALIIKYLVFIFVQNQLGSFYNIGIEAFVLVMLPVGIIWILTKLSYKFLERHFFVFVLFNGFFVAAFSLGVTLFAVVFLLWTSGVYSYEHLSQTFMPIIPLLVFPEALVNSVLIALLVILKPEWLSCFDDKQYLEGK